MQLRRTASSWTQPIPKRWLLTLTGQSLHFSLWTSNIEAVLSYKYLAVYPDNKLDWTANTDALHRKGQNRLRSSDVCRGLAGGWGVGRVSRWGMADVWISHLETCMRSKVQVILNCPGTKKKKKVFPQLWHQNYKLKNIKIRVTSVLNRSQSFSSTLILSYTHVVLLVVATNMLMLLWCVVYWVSMVLSAPGWGKETLMTLAQLFLFYI